MRLWKVLLLLQLNFFIIIGMHGCTSSSEAAGNVYLRFRLNSTTDKLYHRSDVLLTEIKALVNRHPNSLRMEDLHSTSNGYTAYMRVVTCEFGHTNRSSAEKLRLLLVFGQHGRELVTSEVALRLLSILVGEHSLGSKESTTLQNILLNSIIKIIPMENVSGRKKVEGGDFCERKNGRGVDTNRNWGLDWGKKEKDYDPAEEYPGTEPFSEPETRIVRRLAKTFRPHLWVNVHSGMEALFMPYDHKSTMPDDGSAEPMTSLLQTINRLHCGNRCVVGSGGGSVGYLAHGTATDYMFDTLKVPMAFTFEIYGDSKATNEECFRMFNPASPDHFEQVVSNWSAAFITLFVNVPRALKNMPGRVWLHAQEIDSFGSVTSKMEENESYERSSRIRTPWPRIDTSLGHVFNSQTEADQTMHQFLMSVYVLWGLLLLFLGFRLGKRWCWGRRPLQRFSTRIQV